ncbi:hypothetical protein H012_gp101 [Acanthamoeba polyphaga moumouvirus]|uniref:Uncharacterized protein n=1 Tax=Acanthamoeba polyphaga moumouvirus TaxID=1269028 RepID=L7RE05_9VIRU|nr:hypothetical protein H012_gp101 [Acanthamoeba polyphaga moumouvirus]AGC02348.1 hypothetical protein Moumou_00831 [Acanthamoeba polyphaga moumouvirus]
MSYHTLIKNLEDACWFNDERAKILLDYTKYNHLDGELFTYLQEILDLFSGKIKLQVLKFLLEKISCGSTEHLTSETIIKLLNEFNDRDKVIAARMLQSFYPSISSGFLYMILLNSHINNESNIIEISKSLLIKTNTINGNNIFHCMNLLKKDENKIKFLNIVCHKTTFSEIDVAKILDSFVYSNDMIDAFILILNKSKNFTLDDDGILFICRSLQPGFRNIFINTLVESPKISNDINIKKSLPYVLICSVLSKYLDRDTYTAYINKYIKVRENIDNDVCDILKPTESIQRDKDIKIQKPPVENWLDVLKNNIMSQNHKILSETITINDNIKTIVIVFSNGSNVIYSEKIN